MPTAAHANYVTASGAVGALLKLESEYTDPPDPQERPLVEAIRGGVAVLSVGAFEQYLKEVITEVVENIDKAHPPCVFTKLPEDLQVSAVYMGLERALKGAPGETKKTRLQRVPDVFSTVKTLHGRRLDAISIAQTGSNPGPETVISMCKSIGLRTALHNAKKSFDSAWGTPTASTFLNDQLEAIVLRRHAVAHTASAMALSRTDLADAQRFLRVLVDVLDAMLLRHQKRVITAAQ